MYSLKNQKVILTGAAHGIGRALALAFAKEGAQVAGCSRGWEGLKSLSKEMEGSGHVFFAADLSNSKGIHEFFNEAQKVFNGIDVLINNVGAVLKLANFFEVSDEDWDNSFQVNLMSAVRLSRLSIPELRKSSCPRIINISSIAASHPQDIFPHYNHLLKRERKLPVVHADGKLWNACPKRWKAQAMFFLLQTFPNQKVSKNFLMKFKVYLTA